MVKPQFSTVFPQVFHIIRVLPRFSIIFPPFFQRFSIVFMLSHGKNTIFPLFFQRSFILFMFFQRFSMAFSTVFPKVFHIIHVLPKVFHCFYKGLPYYSCCSTVKTQFFHSFFTGVPCFPYFFIGVPVFQRTAMSSQDGQGGPPRRHRGDREELGHRALENGDFLVVLRDFLVLNGIQQDFWERNWDWIQLREIS